MAPTPLYSPKIPFSRKRSRAILVADSLGLLAVLYVLDWACATELAVLLTPPPSAGSSKANNLYGWLVARNSSIPPPPPAITACTALSLQRISYTAYAVVLTKYCLNHCARTCCSLRIVTRCRFTNWPIRCEQGGRNVHFLSINLISFRQSRGIVLVMSSPVREMDSAGRQ